MLNRVFTCTHCGPLREGECSGERDIVLPCLERVTGVEGGAFAWFHAG